MARKDYIEEIKEMVGEINQRLDYLEGGMIERMQDKVQDLGKKARKKAIDAEKMFEGKIEDNPLKAIGITFAIGALAGILATSFLKK